MTAPDRRHHKNRWLSALPSGSSADARLRPEAKPRPSKMLIPDSLGRKAGQKARAAAGDSRN
jgi:hypothetical protein